MKTKLLLPLLGFLAGCTSSTSVNVAEFKQQIRHVIIEQPIVQTKSVESVALQYIGYSEKTHRQELKELTGVDPVRTEWCAAFVNAVLNESGFPGSDTVSDYPLTARSFLHWGEVVETPVAGDLVIFPRGSEAWQGHVGFFISEIKINGVRYYYILGGNQNGKVSIERFRASRALGIRRHSDTLI